MAEEMPKDPGLCESDPCHSAFLCWSVGEAESLNEQRSYLVRFISDSSAGFFVRDVPRRLHGLTMLHFLII